MPESWATSGIDFHLDLSGPRVRAGLERALRDAVRSGRLPGGARLPSSRALAADLGIARNTVADAYGQLVAEGWLVAQQGSGTRVADRTAAAGATAATVPSDVSGSRHDLRAGSPDLASFPRSAWLAASRRALSGAPSAAFGYTDPRGRPELRRALADYLARARGVHASPERIVVCSGFAQGLALACRALRSTGATTLAAESYGLPSNNDIVGANGLHLTTVPVDGQGAAVSAASSADALLLTPAHQFPLGMVLSPSRRADAVRWAAETRGVVIEDDYDGEFRYDRQPVGALQALAPEHVIYAGTASKTLAPGLRLAWLVLPARLVDAAVAAKTFADNSASAVDQLTLAEFITSGLYDRQVRARRLVYRRRRDRLVAALRSQVPGAHVTGIAAGLHALVELPDGQSEEEVIHRAARHGLAIEGLDAYNTDRCPHQPSLVVGYATPPDHAFTGTVARLCAVLGR